VSEIGKFAPNLRGFPTPNTASEESAYLLFLFNDPLWAQYILGACTALTFEWDWYEAGDLSPLEAADAFNEIVQEAPYNLQSSDVPPPYWDTVGDSDDESSPTEQTWYGQYFEGTFTEVLENWVIAGFIASSGNVGAAIAFLTIAPKFRLAFKTGNIGGIIRIFIDAADYGTVDTNSEEDGIIYKDFVAGPETDTHQVYVVLDALPEMMFAEDVETAAMVVRKFLSPDEISPPTVRYSGDPPVFQTTDDGGSTWVDSPETDPRYNPANILPPLTPYTGIECDGAARLTAQLKDTLDIFIATGDAAQFATQVVAIIVFPFGLAGWFLDLLVLVANVLIDIGQADIEAAFTTGVYDDIQCIFSCYVDGTGQITQSALDSAYEDIKAAHAGVVASTIDELRFLYGDVAMDNAIVSRTETGDCSGCDPCGWFVEFDFSGGNTDNFKLWIDSSFVYGGYTGDKFIAAPISGIKELLFYVLLGSVEVTGVSFYGQQGHGTGGTNNLYYYDVTGTSTFSQFHLITSGGITNHTPVGWYLLFGGDVVLTEGMGFYWNVSSDGLVEIQKIRIGGVGPAPTIGRRVGSLYG